MTIARTYRWLLMVTMVILWGTPLMLFWGMVVDASWEPGRVAVLAGLMILSIAAGALPARSLRSRSWEVGGGMYERLGVRSFKRFMVGGDIYNRWMREGDPGYRLYASETRASGWTLRRSCSRRLT